MHVDLTAFTPGPALAGGLLIGLAAALLLFGSGRIAGVSGIVGGLLRAQAGDRAWRLAFVAGLLAAPGLYAAVAPLPLLRIEAGGATLLVAGFLVGLGTRYGSGCTSGHGVCGLSRLSPRSLVATLSFMAAGFVTVFIVPPVLSPSAMNALIALAAGLIFGLGLLVSGMANPAKVLGFLDLAGAWDPSLMLVMAGAIAVGLPTFALARRRGRSWRGAELQLPPARAIDRRLIAGSMLFGIGWGLAGFCPGPALTALGAGEGKALLFVLGMLGGMAVFEWREARRRAGTRQ